MKRSSPKKGDIVLLDFDPQAGHEQTGTRPALVVSPKAFNSKSGFALVCPITNQSKGYPFEVSIAGAKGTTGVILADQVKSLDWAARRMKTVDKVSDGCLASVIGMIELILNADET